MEVKLTDVRYDVMGQSLPETEEASTFLCTHSSSSPAHTHSVFFWCFARLARFVFQNRLEDDGLLLVLCSLPSPPAVVPQWWSFRCTQTHCFML